MDPDSLAPRGSFGTGLIAVGASEGSLAPERAVSRNPAEVLAQLMDFPGSVALAELFEAPVAAASPAAELGPRGERLIEDVRARLDALEPMALKPLLGRRAPELLAPHELMQALVRHGLGPVTEPPADGDAQTGGGRSERALLALADDLGEPFASALGASLRQAQAHVATLRWEIAHDIRGLGPRADQLERLDAALTRSMQARMGELLDRMEYAARLTFERACAHALEELPECFGEDDLARWSAEDGWLGRYRERCVRMTRALFGHLRRGLEGLLRAATQGEEV